MSSGRVLASAAMGSILEWYDFSVFGFLAPQLGEAFFGSSSSAEMATLKAFSVYGAAFAMRPLGAVVFGHIGDAGGRARALSWALLLMAAPALAIGCLPTYATAGARATVALVALRLIQGLSVGGQIAGAYTTVVDSAPPRRRGLHGALCSCGNSLGVALAALTIAVCTATLGNEAMSAWGWRVPFLLSGALAPVSVGLFFSQLCGTEKEPHAAHEPTAATAKRRSDRRSSEYETEGCCTEGCCEGGGCCGPCPAAVACSQHGGRIALVTLAIASSGTSSYFVSTFLPIYLMTLSSSSADGQELSSSRTTAATVVVTTSTVLLLPLIGRLSDALGPVSAALCSTVGGDEGAVSSGRAAHLSRRHLMTLGYVLMTLLSMLGGWLLESGLLQDQFWKIVGLQLGFSTLNALPSACLAAFEVENFRGTGVTYTAVALSHNVSMALFGGTTPMIATWLYGVKPILPFAYMSLVSFVSLVALQLLPMPPLAAQKGGELKQRSAVEEDAPLLATGHLIAEQPKGLIMGHGQRQCAADVVSQGAPPSWAEGF